MTFSIFLFLILDNRNTADGPALSHHLPCAMYSILIWYSPQQLYKSLQILFYIQVFHAAVLCVIPSINHISAGDGAVTMLAGCTFFRIRQVTSLLRSSFLTVLDHLFSQNIRYRKTPVINRRKDLLNIFFFQKSQCV